MEFEFTTSFYLSPADEQEILGLIKNGMEIERAVEDWRNGLDDCDYFEVLYVKEQIIAYIGTLMQEGGKKMKDDLIMMTPQELRNHIKECEKFLRDKEQERFSLLVRDIVTAAKKLLEEYPRATLRADPYCEVCEERIDVQLDIECLTYENNYVDY